MLMAGYSRGEIMEKKNQTEEIIDAIHAFYTINGVEPTLLCVSSKYFKTMYLYHVMASLKPPYYWLGLKVKWINNADSIFYVE